MMKGKEWRYLIAGLALVDGLALAFAFTLAAYIRFALLPYYAPFEPRLYAAVVAGLVPVFIALFWVNDLYSPEELLGGPQEYARVVNACTYGLVALLALSFLYREPTVSRAWLLLCWSLSIVVVGLARFTIRRVAYKLRHRGLFVTRVLIAGASDQGIAIARQVHSPQFNGIDVAGFLDDYLPAGTLVGGDFRVLGAPTAAQDIAQQVGACEVIVVPQALAWESLMGLVQTAASPSSDLDVKLAASYYDLLVTGVRVSQKGFVPLLALEKVRIRGVDAVLKGVLDYTLALGLLVALLPLLALLALGLKVKSGGPVLERQRVVGKQGRAFAFLSFHWDSAKLPLLRRLPSLWNVVAGQASLVGPRPTPPEELPAYSRWATNLFTVRPGLTGPWRLGGEEMSLEERAIRDLYYVRNYSIWLDLHILFQTLKALGAGLRDETAKLARWELGQAAKAGARRM